MKSNCGFFNNAGSSSVGQVDVVNVINGKNAKVPDRSNPNSVTKKFINNKLATERYYDEKGNPYLDIDYTDHGNPKTHPHVPHEHHIKIIKGKIIRTEESDIDD